MSNKIHQGGCVCGDIRYEVTGDPDIVIVCHCEWCQRRTGSAFAMIPKWEQTNFKLTSGTLKAYREVNEFGRWLDLKFCPRCGTNIGFTQERRPTAQAVDAGTLDDPSIVNRHNHDFRYIFMRSHQDWTAVPKGEAIYDGPMSDNVSDPPPARQE
jgi:hypothetical protein